MPNAKERYIEKLRKLITGRVPSHQVECLLTETASHLDDLEDHIAQEPDAFAELAVKRFGSARRLARRMIPIPAVQCSWKACRLPLAIVATAMLGWEFLPPAKFIYDHYEISSMTLLYLLGFIGFIIPAFFTRRLFIGQIALFTLVVGVYMGAATWNQVPSAGLILPKSEVPEYLAALDASIAKSDAKVSDLQKGLEVFAGEPKTPSEVGNLGYAGGYYKPEWFRFKDIRVSTNYPHSGFHVLTRSFSSKTRAQDPNDFLIFDWDSVAKRWKQEGTAFLGSEKESAQSLRAYHAQTVAAIGMTPLQRMVAQRYPFTTMAKLFLAMVLCNLIAWMFGKLWTVMTLPRRIYAEA